VLQGKELEQGGAYCRGTRSSREEQRDVCCRGLGDGARAGGAGRSREALAAGEGDRAGWSSRGRSSGREEQQGKEELELVWRRSSSR
jgi:hypothetical protein